MSASIFGSVASKAFSYFMPGPKEAVTAEEAVMMLPLVKALDHEEVPLLQSAMVTAIAKEYTISKELQEEAASRKAGEYSTRKRYLKRDLADTTSTATNLINKQFRKVSLKIHPDRHGEQFRAEFEALCLAKDTLQDAAQRKEYVATLLTALKARGVGDKGHQDEKVLQEEHQEWMEGHVKQEEGQSAAAKYQEKMNSLKSKTGRRRLQRNKDDADDDSDDDVAPTLFLEANFFERTPKMPYVRSIEHHTIT
ncbi:MAG: hypothetical protein SGARI_007128, partial [Bacillariaceae sp.]